MMSLHGKYGRECDIAFFFSRASFGTHDLTPAHKFRVCRVGLVHPQQQQHNNRMRNKGDAEPNTQNIDGMRRERKNLFGCEFQGAPYHETLSTKRKNKSQNDANAGIIN